ncbi:hypothetical protein E1B28_002016 [Marasmius oreades]|uniref:Uncharacterized protein n=1 Tax=Marasmius oreades TaxID=181124 RepID=A0A9P8AG20_9AGAR|nr:uncharacterized protein E1B28_002016 [Marasmius oreades]KAG7100242.1 hypothetical protein E1B28_002016 [Marasmius oreades]
MISSSQTSLTRWSGPSSTALYQETQNETYFKAASQTLQFLRNFEYFPRSNGAHNEPLLFAFDGSECINGPYPDFVYSNTGDIIEGLSTLVAYEAFGQETSNWTSPTLDFLRETIVSATVQREEARPDRILDLGSHAKSGYPKGDAFLVRGISEAYWTLEAVDPLSNLDFLKTFIQIQYDTLLHNATFNGTNIYGGDWTAGSGAPSTPQALSQTFATMVLINSINIPRAEPTPPPKNDRKTKIIGGSFAGGFVFIAILSALMFAHHRRWKKSEESYLNSQREVEVPAEYLPTPFVLPETREMDDNTTGTLTLSEPSPGVIESQSTNAQPEVAQRSEVAASSRDEMNTLLPRVDSEPPSDDDYDLAHLRLHAVSTAELVRVLMARLRHDSSGHRESDMPPAYPESQVGR